MLTEFCTLRGGVFWLSQDYLVPLNQGKTKEQKNKVYLDQRTKGPKIYCSIFNVNGQGTKEMLLLEIYGKSTGYVRDMFSHHLTLIKFFAAGYFKHIGLDVWVFC